MLVFLLLIGFYVGWFGVWLWCWVFKFGLIVLSDELFLVFDFAINLPCVLILIYCLILLSSLYCWLLCWFVLVGFAVLVDWFVGILWVSLVLFWLVIGGLWVLWISVGWWVV